MIRGTESFEINTSGHQPLKPSRAEFDFVGNGVLFALIMGMGLFLAQEYGLLESRTIRRALVSSNLARFPLEDVLAGLIVAAGAFFALSKVRYRLVIASVAGLLAFAFLPTPDQFENGISEARNETLAMIDNLQSRLVETKDKTGASNKMADLETAYSYPVEIRPIDELLTVESSISHDMDLAAIEPAAAPEAQAIIAHDPVGAESMPFDAAEKSARALLISKLGLTEMANGNLVARIRVGQDFLTAEVRPDAPRTTINRFDLMRLGIVSRGGGLAILPELTIGTFSFSGVAVKVVDSSTQPNIVGTDILMRIDLSQQTRQATF